MTPRNDQMRRRNLVRLAAAATCAALLVSGCSKKDEKPAPTTTTTSTTTSTTTTTVPEEPAAIAPLTGIGVDDATAERLKRPALALKIDNIAAAMPQGGLNSTDVVIEMRAEGVSRLMAVFHTHDHDFVGPVRSARAGDPALLALLGKPLFGWSGANAGVTRIVNGATWVVNVNWDRQPSAYHRERGRRAPHNLFTDTNLLFPKAEPDQGPPPQMFEYLGQGEQPSNAQPAAGVQLRVGDTPSAWKWDAAKGVWLRSQYGRVHQAADGERVNATNVVVLEINYRGGSSPIPDLTGAGRALVFTDGKVVEGIWTRENTLMGVTLTGADKKPIKLTPGRTWIELTHGTTAQVLDEAAAAGL